MTVKLLCEYLGCDHNRQNWKGKVIEVSRQHSVFQNIQKLTRRQEYPWQKSQRPNCSHYFQSKRSQAKCPRRVGIRGGRWRNPKTSTYPPLFRAIWWLLALRQTSGFWRNPKTGDFVMSFQMQRWCFGNRPLGSLFRPIQTSNWDENWWKMYSAGCLVSQNRPNEQMAINLQYTGEVHCW